MTSDTQNTNTPYSLEAEQATLGAVIVNSNSLPIIAGFLNADDFFILRHNYIWQALERLNDRNEAVDYVTLCKTIMDMGNIEMVTPSYVTELINTAPSAQNAEIYARLVERASIRRNLLTSADTIRDLAKDENLTVYEVMAEVEKSLAKPRDRSGSGSAQTLDEIANDYLDDVEKLYNSDDKLVGIPTGITELDSVLGGWESPDLVVIAGRPGMGKSAFMVMNALTALKAGEVVTIHSLEMSARQILQRMIAIEAGLSVDQQKNPSASDYSKIVEVTGRISKDYKNRLFIFDNGNTSPVAMRADCLRVYAKHGLGLAFVDYIQIMNAGGLYRDNKVQQVSYISGALKALAKELSIPVIALAQLSRAVEQRQDKRPLLSDLKESGSIEQDADEIIFLYRDAYYNGATEFPNQMDLIVAKNRDGRTGMTSAYWNGALMQPTNGIKRSINIGNASIISKSKNGVDA